MIVFWKRFVVSKMRVFSGLLFIIGDVNLSYLVCLYGVFVDFLVFEGIL